MQIPQIVPLDKLSATYRGWIADRVGRCVSYLAEEMRLHGQLTTSAMMSQIAPTLLMLASDHEKVAKDPVMQAHFHELVALHQNYIPDDLVSSDFATLNEHTFVAMWSAVEVGVQDTLVAILLNDAEARKVVALDGIKIPEGATPRKVENMVRSWEEKIRKRKAEGKPSHAQSWIEAFRKVGVELSVPSGACADIDEANELRNSILHRHGVIDEEAVARVPALTATDGSRVRLTVERCRRFNKSFCDFVLALLGALAVSRHAGQRE